MTPGQALKLGAKRLAAVGIEHPRLEARLLLAHTTGLSQEALLAAVNIELDESDKVLGQLRSLLDRRAKREPLALILGRREFWSLDFEVSQATLIPRPESETLIEAALACFRHRRSPRCVLDLGTGTGCLLLAALHEFPGAFGIGIDREPAAAALAQRNAAMLGLADRAAFMIGDWARAVGHPFDLILANPTYIDSAEIDRLMPEVSRHEPRTALDGGAEGLDAYRAILPMLPDLLTEAGWAVLEMGVGQVDLIQALATDAGLTTSVRTDLAGIPRALLLRRRLP
ncbi:MAG TPA: peptide chain release factor N(5)-glutamine methyltransferase [Acetobacteraceae bacterium]|nr:peptide chain release factor N(5)-glutamine methyltransferase [Acetobacteraceae bacterium]